MAADVLGFIKEHGLESPTLIGHSMFVEPRSFRSRRRRVNFDILTGLIGAQRRP